MKMLKVNYDRYEITSYNVKRSLKRYKNKKTLDNNHIIVS